MQTNLSRRTFLAAAGSTAAALALPSAFAAPKLPGVRYGYAAITWANAERQAIDDIAAAGFAGVQFRANAVTDFKPDELKSLMADHKLTFVALSSGQVSLEKPAAQQMELHVNNAVFAKAAGAEYLQILDELKGHPRSATPEQCKQLGAMLTELGKRTADVGMPLGYHNHLNTLSEMPDNLERILDAADPKYVKLELDTAHLGAGGGDNSAFLRKYRDRLLFLHLKDFKPIASPPAGAMYPFQFTELGQGTLNFPAIFNTLHEIKYKGWAVVELDREPVQGRTPKESAEMSRAYLEQKLGVTVKS